MVKRMIKKERVEIIVEEKEGFSKKKRCIKGEGNHIGRIKKEFVVQEKGMVSLKSFYLKGAW